MTLVQDVSKKREILQNAHKFAFHLHQLYKVARLGPNRFKLISPDELDLKNGFERQGNHFVKFVDVDEISYGFEIEPRVLYHNDPADIIGWNLDENTVILYRDDQLDPSWTRHDHHGFIRVIRLEDPNLYVDYVELETLGLPEKPDAKTNMTLPPPRHVAFQFEFQKELSELEKATSIILTELKDQETQKKLIYHLNIIRDELAQKSTDQQRALG